MRAELQLAAASRGGPGTVAGAEMAGLLSRLARLSHDCPARPVDWRWGRAGLLLELGLRCWRGDGPTRDARRYLAALGRCRGDAARRRLSARMAGVAGALAIADGEDRVRLAVEAWLLVGAGAAVVAGKLGIAPEAVAWYESLFFNVSDRLASRGYLVHLALGERRRHGPASRNLGILWKSVALAGEVGVLDELIRATWDAAGEPGGPADTPAAPPPGWAPPPARSGRRSPPWPCPTSRAIGARRGPSCASPPPSAGTPRWPRARRPGPPLPAASSGSKRQDSSPDGGIPGPGASPMGPKWPVSGRRPGPGAGFPLSSATIASDRRPLGRPPAARPRANRSGLKPVSG